MTNLKGSVAKKFLVAAFVSATVFILIESCIDTSPRNVKPTNRYSKYSESECNSASETMKFYRSQELVHDIGRSEDVVYVQVDGLLWAGLLYDNKTKAGRVFAAYVVGTIPAVGSDPLVIIKDKHSGKQLCQYGYGLGLRCE